MARFQGSGIASYPEYAQASSGGSTFPVFPVIDEAAAQTNPNSRLQFGDQIVDKFGNIYLYVRAAAALAQGAVVRCTTTGDGDHPAVGTVSASTTTKRIFTNITTTVNERLIGSFLASPGTSVTGGTPFFKRIKGQVAIGANTTFDISLQTTLQGIGQYDGDALSAIPTTGDAVAVVRPYNVVTHGAASATTKENGPVGIALGTVTAAGGTLIQTGGNVLALGLGNGTAIVAGGPVSAAASGAVIGGSAVVDAVVGRSHVAWVGTPAKLIPIRVYLSGAL